MDATALQARRDEVAAEHGAWIGYNIHLGHGVYTMGNDHVGTAEILVHSVVQAVSDLAAKPLSQLRVLDLGCHEGAYAIELGLHGAEVVGVEARVANIEKARFVADALNLERVTFQERDVRDINEEEFGRFDVVLCLGILYHLEAADAVHLVASCHSMCDDLTVVRSAVGLSPNTSSSVDGHLYRGRRYREDTRERGASIDNPTSILPSRVSLLNLLAGVGFSSVHELRNPTVPALEDMVDSLTLVALRRTQVPFQLVPGFDQILRGLRRPERQGPTWVHKAANPQQGPYWKLRERLFHTFARSVFRSRQPRSAWEHPSRHET